MISPCRRTAIPGRAWFTNLTLVPMTIPSLLSAIAWIPLLVTPTQNG